MDIYLIYLISLRLVHMVAGVFWAGAAFTLAGFVEPTVRAAGPEGGRFMQRLAEHSRFSFFMSLSSLLTTGTGLLLYWPASAGLQVGWIASSTGRAFTVGGVWQGSPPPHWAFWPTPPSVRQWGRWPRSCRLRLGLLRRRNWLKCRRCKRGFAKPGDGAPRCSPSP